CTCANLTTQASPPPAAKNYAGRSGRSGPGSEPVRCSHSQAYCSTVTTDPVERARVPREQQKLLLVAARAECAGLAACAATSTRTPALAAPSQFSGPRHSSPSRDPATTRARQRCAPSPSREPRRARQSAHDNQLSHRQVERALGAPLHAPA